ncbi:MAG: cupin domain-containing protein [Lachnospiraceae bacterium]|nr:cupin domain-containing protein [Lachnospiraceae bacterium]
MQTEQVTESIGRKIRNLRQERNLTQQELADRTELTKGYISQLENGQVAPSVITLLDIIECLGSTPSEFFTETGNEPVVYSEGDFFEKIDDDGNSIQWIVPTAQKNSMEPLLVELKPGNRLAPDKPHEGEEFGFVISGRVKLHLGDDVFTAKAGESFYYNSGKNHWIENPYARPAKFIWVSTPPSF